MIYLFFSWAALGSKPGCPGSTGHSYQVSGRSLKASRSFSATSPRDLTKPRRDMGMLVAAARAGLVQGPDPGGPGCSAQLGTSSQLTVAGFLPSDAFFFSRAGPSCAKKLTVLKVKYSEWLKGG